MSLAVAQRKWMAGSEHFPAARLTVVIRTFSGYNSRTLLILSNPLMAGLKELISGFVLRPLWILPDYFPMMEKYGMRRIIALSSTSRFTKIIHRTTDEMVVARQLSESEDRLRNWAQDERRRLGDSSSDVDLWIGTR